MYVLSHRLPRDHDLVLFGDDHEGNLLRYDKGVEELKNFILSEPNRYAIHMGDEMDAFYLDDPRYSVETVKSAPIIQQQNVLETFKPIVSRLLGIMMGNHTYKLLPKIGNVTQDTCKRLGVPYGGYWCKFEIHDKRGKPLYKVFAEHGAKSISSAADDPIRRRANMELTLKRHLFQKAGDCILLAKGHCHKLLVADPRPALYMTTDGGQIRQNYTHPESGGDYIPPENRWYAATGSFLRTSKEGVTSYAERADYDPVELGFVVAEVRDGKMVRVYEKVI